MNSVVTETIEASAFPRRNGDWVDYDEERMKPAVRISVVVAVLVAALAPNAVAQSSCPRPHWAATWAGVPSDASAGSDIADVFSASGDLKEPVNNSTVRAVLTPTMAGSTVRVHLSNRFGTVPVTFSRTTIARKGDGAALGGTPATLTFGGKRAVTVAPGRDVVSDAARFGYGAFQTLAVTTYVSSNAGKPTEHFTARQTSYQTAAGTGDHSTDSSSAAFSQHTTTRPFVTGLDVRTNKPAGAVVTFGDSITDGYQGQSPAGVPETKEGIDANGRWPDVLGRRLRAARIPLSVVNAGISGNRVLRDPSQGGQRDTNGPAAIHRLGVDVLRQSGVTTVILLEGGNDLGQDPAAGSQEIIDGYRQLITRLHAAHLRVLQVTLTPMGGAGRRYGTAETNAKRQAINTWIRTKSPADGVIDFDKAVRDPADPSRINPKYDGGDHLHYNLAGYKRLGDTVRLSQLRRPVAKRRVTFRVPRRYRTGLKRVYVVVGKHHIARSSRASVTATLPLSRVVVRLRLVRPGHRAVTLLRIVHACPTR